MSGPVWTFRRGQDVIVVRCPEPLELIASEPTQKVTRRFSFHSPHERVTFQSDFENHLLNTGWSLSAFTRGSSTGGWFARWAFWWRRN